MDEPLSSVLASLHERFDPLADAEHDVRAFLLAEGYEERRIGEILALFYGDASGVGAGREAPSAGPPEPFPMRQPVAFRVLGPHERARFAPEAWGHLLRLSAAGMLSPAELEQVIDRALAHVEGRIGVDDLRAMMDGVGEGEGRAPGGGMTIH